MDICLFRSIVDLHFTPNSYLTQYYCLTYIGETIQRLIDDAFRGLPFLSTYIDAVYASSGDMEDYKIHLRLTLHFGLKTNADKCNFGGSKVNYFGKEIDQEVISPLPNNIEAI